MEVARNLGINITDSKICGGGAKSVLWKKIIANVLNVRLDILKTEEGPSMVVRCWRQLQQENTDLHLKPAGKIVQVVDHVEPDPGLVSKYEMRYREL